MSDLSDQLKKIIRENGWSLRDAEREWGISHSAIDRIIKNTRHPELETLIRLSQGLNVPLWKIMEMAGFDLGFQPQDGLLTQRLTSLLERMPEFRPVAEQLVRLNSEDLYGFVIYLEGVQAHRNRKVHDLE